MTAGQPGFAAWGESWLSPPLAVYTLKLHRGSSWPSKDVWSHSLATVVSLVFIQLALAMHPYTLPLLRPLIWVRLITDHRHPFKGSWSLRSPIHSSCLASTAFPIARIPGSLLPAPTTALLIAAEACKPPPQLLSCPKFLFPIPSLLPTWEVLGSRGCSHEHRGQAGRIGIVVLMITCSVILSKLPILHFVFLLVRSWCQLYLGCRVVTRERIGR